MLQKKHQDLFLFGFISDTDNLVNELILLPRSERSPMLLVGVMLFRHTRHAAVHSGKHIIMRGL